MVESWDRKFVTHDSSSSLFNFFFKETTIFIYISSISKQLNVNEIRICDHYNF